MTQKVYIATEADKRELLKMRERIDTLLRGGGAGGVGARDVDFRRTLAPIPAKITDAGDSDGQYKATEQVWDDSESAWIDKPSGRVWDGGEGNLAQLYEANGLAGVPVGTLVIVRRTTGDEGATVWWFDSGVRIGSVFAVDLEQTGGSAGNDTTQCSYTYTIDDLDGNELATAVDPTSDPHRCARPSIGALVAATHGTACYLLDDDALVLALCTTNETLDPAACA